MAKLVNDIRRIGKGWNRWQIRKIDNDTQCYRCRKVGNCIEKEEETKCYKCGELGQIKKEYKGVQKCYLYKTEGHKAESLKCPEYRKMQEAQKKERRISVISV